MRKAMNGSDRHVLPLVSLVLLAILAAAPAVRAEIDLSGTWLIVYHEEWQELGAGPDIGDYTGMPINEANRLRALTWHPSLIDVPERQCMQLPVEYTNLWSNMRLWQEVQPDTQDVIAWKIRKAYGSERTLWMDGRPHPSSRAAHSTQGFSTAEWDRDMLKVTTTHVKEGYIRRNGLYRSDRATVIEHYIRHGDMLTVSTVTNDPVYLTEPRIRTSSYLKTVTTEIAPYPCEVVTELPSVTGGRIPHFYPWKNPYAHQFPDKYKIPAETALGGAKQMYPEFVE
jgi:hypothetical protein